MAATHRCNDSDRRDSVQASGRRQAAHVAKVSKGTVRIYAEDADSAGSCVQGVEEFAVRTDGNVEIRTSGRVGSNHSTR